MRAVAACGGMVAPAHQLLDIQFLQAADAAFLAPVRMHIAPISAFTQATSSAQTLGQSWQTTFCAQEKEKSPATLSGTFLQHECSNNCSGFCSCDDFLHY